MAEGPKDEEQAEAKAPEKPSKLIPIILIANSVLMAAVLAVVLLRKPATPVAVMAPAPRAGAAPAAGAAGEKGKEEGGKHGEAAGHGEGAAAADPSGAPGPILKLENFIIQLRSTESDRYVRVAFDLELVEESDRAVVTARMSQVRDAVISYFSDRSLDELRGSEGMDRIKQSVAKRLDEILLSHRVKAVFITELVIQ
jgi:flagellar FliL protein